MEKEFGVKVETLNGYASLIKDTDWEGKTVYYIGLLSDKNEEGRAFHRVKISKRDWEKLKKVSEKPKTLNELIEIELENL